MNETLAPDVLAKQIGAVIENWDALKVVSGALVDGKRVGVLVEATVPGSRAMPPRTYMSHRPRRLRQDRV
ncbi:MAG: hypothetical protein IPI35_29995 [Deltaproteobacteria bacterium]|nr:hypothetical protein [Deltaproteobacteria bacterium]